MIVIIHGETILMMSTVHTVIDMITGLLENAIRLISDMVQCISRAGATVIIKTMFATNIVMTVAGIIITQLM